MFADSQRLEYFAGLPRRADSGARPGVGREDRNVATFNPDQSRRWSRAVRYLFEQSRLSDAVAADERQRFASGDGKRDALDDCS